jgi:hypothetical protein
VFLISSDHVVLEQGRRVVPFHFAAQGVCVRAG